MLYIVNARSTKTRTNGVRTYAATRPACVSRTEKHNRGTETIGGAAKQDRVLYARGTGKTR